MEPTGCKLCNTINITMLYISCVFPRAYISTCVLAFSLYGYPIDEVVFLMCSAFSVKFFSRTYRKNHNVSETHLFSIMSFIFETSSSSFWSPWCTYSAVRVQAWYKNVQFI